MRCFIVPDVPTGTSLADLARHEFDRLAAAGGPALSPPDPAVAAAQFAAGGHAGGIGATATDRVVDPFAHPAPRA